MKWRLFVVGDSISMQYGPYLSKYISPWCEYDRKKDDAGAPKAEHNLDVPNGANGGDSSMVLAYLRKRKETGGIPADLLLLNCGLHDLKIFAGASHQISLEKYRNNLKEIIKEVKEMNLRIAWVTTTPVIDECHNSKNVGFTRYSEDVLKYNEAANEIMKEAGIPKFDLYSFTQNFIPSGFLDHVHFKSEIQNFQAIFLSGCIQSYFENLQLPNL